MDRRLPPLRDERGTSLIEVLVAAVILVVISGAVTTMLNASTAASGQQRVQAIAADLAQSTLEEWRSQPFTKLQNLDVGGKVDHGGIVYDVKTTSNWAMENPPGAQGCSSGGRSPEALRVSTTVTWTGMKRKPVVLDTLVAAPAGSSAHRGTFVVQVTNRDGYGVSAVPVTLAGGPSGSTTGSTDDNGCVRFTDILEGRYLMSFSKSGYITPSGATGIVNEEVDVVAGQTRSAGKEYDLPGTVNARFIRADQPLTPGTPANVFAAHFRGVDMNRTQTSAVAQSAFTQSGLYPQIGQYEVFPDTCASGRPATPGVTVPQGGTATVDFKVPVLRLTADKLPSAGGSSGTLREVQVRVRSACGSRFATEWRTRPNGNGNAEVSFDPLPVPGGVVQLCAVYRYNDGIQRWTTKTASVDVNQDTTTPPKIDMSSPTFSGLTTNPTCPT